MPGYLLHYAVVKPELLNNRSFMLGVETPDILKKHIKLYGVDEARKKYNCLKTPEMPDYDRLEKRALQPESPNSTEGLHYGVSSNPNIQECWNELTDEEKNNPFFRGYVWHILTDYIMYKRLDIDKKFAESFTAFKDKPNFEEIRKKAVDDLHQDWDKINFRVKATYPEIVLPREIIDLNVIKYIDDDNLVYISWPVLESVINLLRTFDPLHSKISKMEDIIKYIIKS